MMIDPTLEIDALVRDVLERPAMYCSNPASLEDALSLLEVLRNRLRQHGGQPAHEFADYLISKGYNAMSLNDVADSMGLRGPKERFQFIADAWRDFQSAAGRAR